MSDSVEPQAPEAAAQMTFKKPKLSFGSEVKRIDLEEGTWVEYRMPPYEEYMTFLAEINDKKDTDKTVLVRGQLDLLKKTLVAWSDTTIPCTPEEVAKLSTDVIIYLAQAIMTRLSPEKKS